MSGLINFVTVADLLESPKPDPLIEDFVQEQDVVCLYGEPNGGKSFLALDWALCVATGKSWLDIHEVKRGPVVYMAGEGSASLQVRVHAWMKHHNISEIHGAYFQTRPLSLREDDVIDEIQATLETFAESERGGGDPEMNPRLIVVDTLSQFMMGGDENGTDMALFVSNCRRLSHDSKTAILIVHHTNKGGFQERGHTALRGNVDEMFKCQPVYQDQLLVGIDVTNDKQRDKARSAVLSLKLSIIPIGTDSRGKDMSSLVVVPTVTPSNKLPKLKPALLRVLEAMLQNEDAKSLRCLHKHIEEFTDYNRGTISRNLDTLQDLRCVKKGVGNSYLTTVGRAVLDAAGIKREEPEEEE